MTNEATLPGSRPWRLGPDDPVASQMTPPSHPCPFCGSDDLFYFEYTYAKLWAIACRECGSQGPKRRSPRQARQLWDKRGAAREPGTTGKRPARARPASGRRGME